MSYWDDNPELLQLASPTNGGYTGGANLGGLHSDETGGFAPAGVGGAASQAPQAGQFANSQQGFLDWATQKFGVSPTRGAGFANIPQGQLASVVKQYAQATGNTANFAGGPSGDRVDFGQGPTDALTSGGQIWNPSAGGGSGSIHDQNMGGFVPGGVRGDWGPGGTTPGGGGNMPMPGQPGSNNLTAPAPFTYQPNLGNFSGPAQYQTPTPFQSPSNVPQAQQVNYNPVNAPQSQQAQQQATPAQLNYHDLAAPERLNYNPMSTPTAFSGDRQASPSNLSFQNLDTPANYQAERYNGLSAADLASDPSYKFRRDEALNAVEGSAASKGVLRTGNTAMALQNRASDLASTEYSAADARARGTVAQNNASSLSAAQTNAQTGLAYNQNTNQNRLNFGQANINNAFNANEANYGRSANEAQQGFSNAFNVNQANNQGQNAATQANNTNAYNVGNANNQGQFQAGQANISNAANAVTANNQSNLAFGGQNFNQAYQANQANNQGQFNATQANNQNAASQQAAQYGQAANTYGLNTTTQQGAQNQNFNQSLAAFGANQGAQAQNFNQALGAYGQNASTGFQYGAQNQNNALAQYQAQVQAALGQGNLNLGYQNSNNSYALGQGQLGLGYGNLALNQQGQNFNQNLQSYQQNYQNNVLDPWNMNLQLANLGNPGAPNGQANANAQSDLITGAGNANAAGIVGANNAWQGAYANLANMAGGFAAGQYGGTQTPNTYHPGVGQPPYAY